MNLPTNRSTDAWTYYEFGARSFGDQVIAAILHDRDQGINDHGILSELTVKPKRGDFPIVSIFPEGVPLKDETIDTERVSRVAKFIGPVKLQEYPIAVADLGEADEALTELIDRYGRRIALDLTFAFLYGRSMHGSIAPSLAEILQAINALGPDRQTLGLRPAKGLDFGILGSPATPSGDKVDPYTR